MRSKVSSSKPSSSKLSAGYHPSEDEEFMNPRQLEYFRQKLLRWRAELLAESGETLQHLKEESLLKPDITDRASLETERAIELRTRDRERKLMTKSAMSAWSARTATIDASGLTGALSLREMASAQGAEPSSERHAFASGGR